MVLVIITTYKEAKTLSRAIEVFLDENIRGEFKILVVGPDKQTERIASQFRQKYPQISYIKDEGRGKPAALNLTFKWILEVYPEINERDILILTDGDVYIEKGSLKKLLEPFGNSQIGAVSGHPISSDRRNQMFGFWSHFLIEAAHQMRLKAKIFPCSGYLYAIRPIIEKIPEDVLSEDGVITQMIRDKGYKIVYAPESKVYVKYPDNWRDWILQKRRATGGYLQIPHTKTRSFGQEMIGGIKLLFTYPENLKEFYWLKLLYLARIYLWLIIFWDIKVRKKKFKEIWQRVESTK
jgi:cellulose synthase/poly-beta-1,6-N-acetylglucosamine synthase-like glycosyltransferase